MDPKENLYLKRTIARAALDKGTINQSQYDRIISEISQLEEEMNYEEKLKEYRINEAKDQYRKILVTN
jgi:hypothetical protein